MNYASSEFLNFKDFRFNALNQRASFAGRQEGA